MRRSKDLTGKRFGRLTVVKEAQKHVQPCGKKIIVWECVCDCGVVKNVFASNLLSGNTISCGCYKRENASKVIKTIKRKHGESETRLYKTWRHMLSRCENKKDISYKYYGMKGVSVCDEWKNFENFKAWAIENGYAENLTIDRIDPLGNYSAKNCKWETRHNQDRNRRNTINLTYNGKTMCMADWGRELDIPFTTMLGRLRKGKSTEEILSKSKLTSRGSNGRWKAM